MKRIIIIGGGFAGLSALARLQPLKAECEILLIDKKETSDFLPLLPDVIGKRIRPENLCYSFADVKERYGISFIHDAVTAVDVEGRKVSTKQKSFDYDYVIIACGSETNFYGNTEIQHYAGKLDTVSDAHHVLRTIQEKRPSCIAVCGGGYTGVEVITNIWRLCRKRKINTRLCIIQRDLSLIPTLPSWMQTYVHENVKSLGIDIYCNTTVDHMTPDTITLSSGTQLPNAVLIWTAGVKVPQFVHTVNGDERAQGRVAVDHYLRRNDHCYIVGDAASVLYNNTPLRMGVQFSLMEGRCAADNITHAFAGRPLRPFKPVDLGYVIPMANNKACGYALGITVKGATAMMLHYCMCIYRTWSAFHKRGILKDLFFLK